LEAIVPYLSVNIPAGIYRHGTDFESVGRWRDANFIRWQNGSVRPIGGWDVRISSAAASPPRGAASWIDLSGDSWVAYGTYNKLHIANASGTAYDITPAGFTSGSIDATENTSFGGKAYGTAYYGISRPSNYQFQECSVWSLDNWGENLLACMNDDGKIYEWTLNTASPATVIATAPTGNKAMLVTEERFVFALASGGNPRKVAWSDREDNTTWTPTATNEAGDIELQTSGEIMCGLRIRGRTLLLTNLDAHIATYQGPPTVYGFERVGTACGAVSRQAAAAARGGAFWMGQRGFFIYDGSSVSRLPCDVYDYVFDDISRSQMSKVCAVHNSQFGEIWWFYPSASSTENNRYVVYDYEENYWNIGSLDRTAAIDAGVFGRPIWFDSAGHAYNHEQGWSHGGEEPFVESGPISLGEGDAVMKVTEIVPDELNQGEVTLTFKTRFYPNDVERTYGPYIVDNPTGARFTGRQVRMRITGQELVNWRSGRMRLNVVAGGRR